MSHTPWLGVATVLFCGERPYTLSHPPGWISWPAQFRQCTPKHVRTESPRPGRPATVANARRRVQFFKKERVLAAKVTTRSYLRRLYKLYGSRSQFSVPKVIKTPADASFKTDCHHGRTWSCGHFSELPFLVHLQQELCTYTCMCEMYI